MPNTTIQLKKSSTPSAKPADLANGELAINFADGKLYYKNTTSSIVEITPTQSSDFGTVNANGTLLVADTTGDVLTITPGNSIDIVGDAVNDRVTISLSSNVITNIQLAYDKANSANLLAFNTGLGANAFVSSTIAGANSAVGTGANAFTSATIAGANSAVGTAANNFAIATFNAANTRPVGNTLSSIYTVRSTRRSLNFIPGSNITINVDDDSAGDRSNVTITASTTGTAFATKTANYTAVNGDRLLCNTTAGTFIVTLPATPTSGATILIYDIGNFTANPLTVARNASTIEFIADDFSLDIGQTRNEFVYDGSTWHVYSSIGPRGLADTTTVASSIAYGIALG